ncbi:phospholipase D-like domain-containing protein [Nonomuraea sp. NPDC050786]|uniref:phospholipase D-like domain-containing protein n=1 Tax=Nonomuraea sp. NPDC050786 TaxID=3154840 RepID=UPI00340870C0
MIKRLGRSFAALAGSAAVAAGLILDGGTTTAAAADAAVTATAGAPVINRPVFNNPLGTVQERRAIFSQLVGLIDATPAGEQIRGSVFAIGDQEVVDALLTAHRRGVSVKVILDDSTYVAASSHQEYANPAYDALKAGLGTDDTQDSWAVVCDDQFEDADGVDDVERGCLSSQRKSYNHNKYVIFSRTGPLADGTTYSKVVFQASSNITAWDADSAFQDSVTFADNAVYDGYLRYHDLEYKTRHVANVTTNPYFSTPTGSTYRAYFTPRPDPNPTNPASDPLVNALNEVSCSYIGTDGNKHQTDVRIAHTFFYNTRPQVADKLVDLRRKGCWVDIVSRHIDSDIESRLNQAGIRYRECQGQNTTGPYPHTKYLLIDGDYGGDITPRVYTGSANLIGDSVRVADETFVRITSADYHKAYLQHFYMLQKGCGAPSTT